METSRSRAYCVPLRLGVDRRPAHPTWGQSDSECGPRGKHPADWPEPPGPRKHQLPGLSAPTRTSLPHISEGCGALRPSWRAERQHLNTGAHPLTSANPGGTRGRRHPCRKSFRGSSRDSGPGGAQDSRGGEGPYPGILLRWGKAVRRGFPASRSRAQCPPFFQGSTKTF